MEHKVGQGSRWRSGPTGFQNRATADIIPPEWLVRLIGIEPICPKTSDFESGVYTLFHHNRINFGPCWFKYCSPLPGYWVIRSLPDLCLLVGTLGWIRTCTTFVLSEVPHTNWVTRAYLASRTGLEPVYAAWKAADLTRSRTRYNLVVPRGYDPLVQPPTYF